MGYEEQKSRCQSTYTKNIDQRPSTEADNEKRHVFYILCNRNHCTWIVQKENRITRTGARN